LPVRAESGPGENPFLDIYHSFRCGLVVECESSLLLSPIRRLRPIDAETEANA